MPRSLFLTIALSALLISTGGCTVQRTFYVGQSYPANPDPSSVRLFTGEPNVDFFEIAVLHSRSAPDKRVQSRREQLTDLQRRAAEVGADALIDVKLLAEEYRGVTLNRATPIRTPRQGEYKRYFISGTAVKIQLDEGELEEAMWDEIDRQLSTDLADDAALEMIPEFEPAPAPVETPEPARAAY